MIGLGTIINTASIIGAGIVGHFAGNLFKEEQQESVGRVCGISVLFIAIAGAMEGMLKPDGGALTATNTMLVVICVVRPKLCQCFCDRISDCEYRSYGNCRFH